MAARMPLDFDPLVRDLRGLLLGIDDDKLTWPTPCVEWTVADLLDHLLSVAGAFAQAARKAVGIPGTDSPLPQPSALHLPRHWRGRLAMVLEDLAAVWKHPAAWIGTAQADGVTMPAAKFATVTAGELIMHSWDLARATGQEYAADPRTLTVLLDLLAQAPPAGVAGRFGPVVPAGSEPALLDQVVALAGRRPDWRPPRRRHDPPAVSAA